MCVCVRERERERERLFANVHVCGLCCLKSNVSKNVVALKSKSKSDKKL